MNLNKAALGLGKQVTAKMGRLQTEAVMELCFIPLYKIDPGKVKIAFNNTISLHKDFKGLESEPNVLAADVLGFAESSLCERDQDAL